MNTEINELKKMSIDNSKKYFSEFIDIILMLNSNLVLSELFDKIVDLSIRFIGADRGFLMLYNHQGELQIEVAKNSKGEDLITGGKKIYTKNEGRTAYLSQIKDLQIFQTVVDKVIKEGKPIFLPDITEVRELAKAQSIIDMNLQSVICMPLGRRLIKGEEEERRQRHFPTRGELLGILYVDSLSSVEKSRFSGENLHLLQALVDQASVATVNALLYEKVNIDPLTKLYLRPYFESSLKAEVSFTKKHELPLCVMMIDIDFFKNINDLYGHQAGDYVLQTIGQIFKMSLRTSDICARYGGDEFAVILPNTDIGQGKLIAKKMLDALSSYKFPHGRVTISIGISVYPEHAKEPQELLKCADEALYIAKRKGHNRYKVWQKLYPLPERSHITDILTGDPIRDYRNVEMLLQCIKVATSTLDLNKLLNRIVDTILEITNTERCILMMVNKKNKLEVKVARNNKGEELKKEIYYSKSISNKVLRTGIPICLKDIGKEIATESQIDLNLRSAMCVPLYIKNNRFGTIYVDSHQAVRKFSEAELAFLATVASQLALAIENARLHEEAIEAAKIKEKTL